MEPKLDESGNLNTVLEMVFLFLKNQNFFDTSEVFRNECEKLGITLPNKSGKVFFRTEEKISIIKNAKFTDQTIVLETFMQKDTEIDNSSGGDISKYDTETGGKQHLKKQFSQLREEYKNLLTVTAELTKALQVHIVGQTNNINSVLDQCKVIYPSLFDQPVNATEEEDTQSERKTGDSKPHAETRSYREVVTADGSGVSLEPNEDPKKSPCTPVSQRDIQESAVTGVMGPNCCPNKTCKDCTNQISRILEEILSKVMVSPRCEASAQRSSSFSCKSDTNFNVDIERAHCYHCEMRRDNSELQIDNDDDVPKVYIFQRHSAHEENTSIPDKPIQNIVGNNFEVRCNSSLEQPPGKTMTARILQPESTTTQDKFPKKYHPKPVRLMKFQTPLCYVEACEKAQDVNNNCKCAKCIPGKSRYYCGCYDLICKEIAAEMESFSSESTYEKIFGNFYKNKAGEETPNNGKKCSTHCENKNCKGAFISKPRIHRTPPR